MTDASLSWRRLARAATPLVDALAWVVGLSLAALAHADWRPGVVGWGSLALIGGIVVAAHWAGALLLRTYRGRCYAGSLEEACHVLAVCAAATVAALLGQWLVGLHVPGAIALVALPTVVALAVGYRIVVAALERWEQRRRSAAATPVIVFGAGEAGRDLVRSMRADPAAAYRPVAMLDDDPRLRTRRVAGVRVRGGRDRISEVAAETGAGLMVVALPSLPTDVVNAVMAAAVDAGMSVKVLPPLSQIFHRVGVTDLRDLDLNDLLGREPVHTDIDAIAGYVAGRRVLVTGAGGSIGSELCRQLNRFGPAELIMLDRDESALHAVQLSISGRALLDSSDVVLADIRDQATLRALFAQRRPEIVFHAAALKHLPMLEQYPGEAWQTNVLGTLNVLEAAAASDVDCFVNISTDKAARPVSVLGRSKRICERLVARTAAQTGKPYLSVRFGNVLGSRGSVLTTFAGQIAQGRPLTVTHPDVTRYFMTIPEAVELVIQAAVLGRRSEVMVLDMGSPVRIVDLATNLMELMGCTVPIVYTGLREGEKLHEELFGTDEIGSRPLHPAISQVPVRPLETELALGLRDVRDAGEHMIRLVAPDVPAVPGQQAAARESGPVLATVITGRDAVTVSDARTMPSGWRLSDEVGR